MTDLTNCIQDEAAQFASSPVDTQEVVPFVLKPPSVNSKVILQNMEEVLNSVKKQHRQKHKRRREQRRLQRLAENALEAESNVRRDLLPSENGTQENSANKKRKIRKSPLKKCSPVAESEGILKHFERMPKTCNIEDVSKIRLSSSHHDDAVATKTKTNAFEYMMKARNRLIGTDAFVQEPDSTPIICNATHAINDKRRHALQSLVEQKKGNGRSVEENYEARGAYIEEKLEQRAKRLRNMLAAQPKKCLNEEDKELAGKSKKSVAELNNDDSFGCENLLIDERTDDKLSPVKTDRNLLGYFSKANVETNAVPNTDLIEITPKHNSSPPPTVLKNPRKRGRPKPADKVVVRNCKTPSPNREVIVVASTNSNGRPKRTCTGKNRYDDYYLETSREKSCRSTKAIQNKRSDEISVVIELDSESESSTHGNTNTRSELKLAPLFLRQLPKLLQDPDVVRARKEFLRSGVPEKLKEEQIRKQKTEETFSDNFRYFPRISHIQQLSNEELELNASIPALKLKTKPLSKVMPINVRSRKPKGAKIVGITDCSLADYQRRVYETVPTHVDRIVMLPSIDNKRDIIKLWKQSFEQFPTYKCYNQMREKYRHFSAVDDTIDLQVLSESFLVTRRTKKRIQEKLDEATCDDNPPASAPNGELLFTDKYKPLLLEQVLVNFTPVQKLREFLLQWATSEKSCEKSIEDDFSDSSQLLDDTNATMVLLGPHSSGKTNAVFALANDLNFNVLEINAGMKRTGKRLIQDLLEATQSHQISKESSKKHALLQTRRKISSIHGLLPMDAAVAAEQRNAKDSGVRKSLILIEDADIIFDQHDYGFIEAIYTLAQTSKRPVIIVASDPNCSHLQRLIQQNCIEFQQPNALNICRFLSILALIENCPVQMDDLISLYLYNDKNLRKTLLEVQFYIQSGGDGRLTFKKRGADAAQKSATFCASPTKNYPYNEEQHVESEYREDEKLTRQKDVTILTISKAKLEDLKVHSTLFEYFTGTGTGTATGSGSGNGNGTGAQRIPFPVNFNLLRINLTELFRVSVRLLLNHHGADAVQELPAKAQPAAPKRKTRSPKKLWLNNANANATATANASSSSTPMDALCQFYENITIACLLDSQCQAAISTTDYFTANLTQNITHALVEQSIDICLKAKPCPYNLFDTATASKTTRISDQLNNCQLLRTTKATKALDYEPALRAICRNEKQRFHSDRRSSRFYHYLRHFVPNDKLNFTSPANDNLCEVFCEEQLQTKTTTATLSTSTSTSTSTTRTATTLTT